MKYFDDYDCKEDGETYTYAELQEIVAKEYKTMPEEEKYKRLVHGDPTFEEYLVSCMTKNQHVTINHTTQAYSIKDNPQSSKDTNHG